jgi:biopolymer transport protein ExbD
MTLIERVDTTMYALGGTRHFLVATALIAAVSGCQRHPTPVECKARVDAVAQFVATLDRTPPLVADTTWAALHLPERSDLPAPAARIPVVAVFADRMVYQGTELTSLDELGLALQHAAAATKPPVLGLAIDRATSWQRVVDTFELAERRGFEQVELYYAPPAVAPSASTTLDTSDCELLGRALDEKAANAIAPALEACGCRADTAALEVSAWAVLASHQTVRALRIALDRGGTIHAHPAAATWAGVAPALHPGAGWLTAR